MLMKNFAVYDLKAKMYFMPFYMETEAQARRVLLSTALDVGSTLNKFPEDFALHQLGTMDYETGRYTEDIREICRVSELLDGYRLSHPNNSEDDDYEEDI